MFGIDLRPVLAMLFPEIDWTVVPVELVAPVALTVISMIGLKKIDETAFSKAMKPFYGYITIGFGVSYGVGFGILLAHNPISIVGDAFMTYMSAAGAWAIYEAGRNASKALK